jgi:hypothetical protein
MLEAESQVLFSRSIVRVKADESCREALGGGKDCTEIGRSVPVSSRAFEV